MLSLREEQNLLKGASQVEFDEYTFARWLIEKKTDVQTMQKRYEGVNTAWGKSRMAGVQLSSGWNMNIIVGQLVSII